MSVSKIVTAMLRTYDQDERQRDGSRHWDSVVPVLVETFSHKGARYFDDGYRFRTIGISTFITEEV